MINYNLREELLEILNDTTVLLKAEDFLKYGKSKGLASVRQTLGYLNKDKKINRIKGKYGIYYYYIKSNKSVDINAIPHFLKRPGLLYEKVLEVMEKENKTFTAQDFVHFSFARSKSGIDGALRLLEKRGIIKSQIIGGKKKHYFYGDMPEHLKDKIVNTNTWYHEIGFKQHKPLFK